MTVHYTPGVGATLYHPFTTNASTGAAVAPSSAFEAADVRIYKNGSATQRSSEAGYTMTSPFDSVTGLHMLAIDLSDNTDSGFYAVGSTYHVVLVPDETVDSVSVVAVLCSFRIVAAESSAGVPKVDLTHISGSAVSTSTAQLGVNAVQAGGTAWASGAITATSIASGAITAAKFAAGAIDAAAIADGAIDAGAFAADAITAAKVASDVGSEIATAVLTAAASAPIDANVKNVAGTRIAGTGVLGDEWGPA